MKLSQQSQAIIESAIQKAINKYTCGCEQTIVTDIHIQPNQNSGELFISGCSGWLTASLPPAGR